MASTTTFNGLGSWFLMTGGTFVHALVVFLALRKLLTKSRVPGCGFNRRVL